MFPFKLILCLLILGMTSCQHVSDVSARSQTRSSYLQQAINYLVNYTATETETHMDMNDIGSRVAAIAYEKLTENLGRCNYVEEAFVFMKKANNDTRHQWFLLGNHLVINSLLLVLFSQLGHTHNTAMII